MNIDRVEKRFRWILDHSPVEWKYEQNLCVTIEPSLLHHSFSLGPARFITQPSPALVWTG